MFALFMKDMKNTYRFRAILISDFFSPFLMMVSFLITYSAVFFVGGVEDLGYINRTNFIIYLLTGSLAYNFVRVCWNRTSLQWEKVMKTLEGMLLTPINRIYILLGKSLNALMFALLSVIPYTILLLILQPPEVSVTRLIMGIAGIILSLIIFISIDFSVSAIQINQEGYARIINAYAPRAISVLSCVYFPITVFQGAYLSPIRYLVLANPVYHSVALFRSAFLEVPDLNPAISLAYLLILAVIIPLISVRFFEWNFKKYGIKGY